jgi:hypothetical protein
VGIRFVSVIADVSRAAVAIFGKEYGALARTEALGKPDYRESFQLMPPHVELGIQCVDLLPT